MTQVQDRRVSIGLIKPKSPGNVGAVLRAVGCFQANSVFYTGSRYDRASRFYTDTKDSHQTVPLTRAENLLDCIPAGAQVVCIELVEGAAPLPDFPHPDNAFYIFGPEDGTINQALIDRADAVAYIPTIGSLNLAACVNVVLYDRLSKANAGHACDELIRQSRDTNNTVKLRNRR